MSRLIINGIATKVGTSMNGMTYTASALNEFAPTMGGVPLQIDHSQSIKNTIGRVSDGKFDGNKVFYDAWIAESETEVIGKIKDGRITSVSIGAFCRLLENKKTGEVFPVGMKCVELSLVSMPAMDGTSVLTQNKINNKPQTIVENIGEIKMTNNTNTELIKLLSRKVVEENINETKGKIITEDIRNTVDKNGNLCIENNKTGIFYDKYSKKFPNLYRADAL